MFEYGTGTEKCGEEGKEGRMGVVREREHYYSRRDVVVCCVFDVRFNRKYKTT